MSPRGQCYSLHRFLHPYSKSCSSFTGMRKFFNYSLPHGRCYSFQRSLQLFVASWPMLFNLILLHSVNFLCIPGLRLTALLGSFLVFRILLCIMAVACKSFSDVSVTSLVIFCFPSRSWMTVLKGSQFPFSVTEVQNCHPQSHLPIYFGISLSLLVPFQVFLEYLSSHSAMGAYFKFHPYICCQTISTLGYLTAHLFRWLRG